MTDLGPRLFMAAVLLLAVAAIVGVNPDILQVAALILAALAIAWGRQYRWRGQP